MAWIDQFIHKQKEGAQFVITAQVLRLKPQDFDMLAQQWLNDGGPGFKVAGVPHRSLVDGEFFISRVTVIKTRAPSQRAMTMRPARPGNGQNEQDRRAFCNAPTILKHRAG